MRHQKYNLWLMLTLIVGLKALYTWGPQGLYTFHGHGRELRDALIAMYWLLCATHAMFAGIMWTQRDRWDAAETSTFRFISVKAILWGFLALTTRPLNGIPLAYTYLLIFIGLTTIDLDVQLVRRYIIRRKEG